MIVQDISPLHARIRFGGLRTTFLICHHTISSHVFIYVSIIIPPTISPLYQNYCLQYQQAVFVLSIFVVEYDLIIMSTEHQINIETPK